MPLPATRDELVDALTTAVTRLDAECATISESDARRPELDGDVSVCDVLAYQVGWGELLLGWERIDAAGGDPDLPAPGYGWNQLGDLARSFHETHRHASLAELRIALRTTVDQVLAMIGDLSDDALFEVGDRRWAGPKWPVVKWIQVNTIAPYRSARTKIRRWQRERGQTS